MQQTYSLREISALLGLSRAVIGGLVAAGFVTPARGERGELRFGFQDLVLLRTAHELRNARIPPRRILAQLRRLRAALPAEVPLSGLRIAAVGGDVVVREGGGAWAVKSGQRLLFDVEPQAAPADEGAAEPRPVVRAFVRPGAKPAAATAEPSPPTAEPAIDWFARAVELEARDPAAARAAYRRAIEARPESADAYLNLGVLLADAGAFDEAVAIYTSGLVNCPGEPLLHFNLAVALEDAGDTGGALRAYAAALALDPQLADAHFNAARLHDRLGHSTLAIRHYSAYRRLTGDGKA